MDFFKGRKLAMILIVAALALAIIGSVLSDGNTTVSGVALAGTVVLLLAGIAVIIKFCRCKHCGKVVFMGLMKAEYCPRCKRGLATGLTKKQEKKDRKA